MLAGTYVLTFGGGGGGGGGGVAASVVACKWNCLLFVQAWLQLYEGFPALLHRPTSGQSAKD